MLVRDLAFPVKAFTERLLATCSALVTTGSTGVVTPIADTTADAAVSTGDIGDVATAKGSQVSSGGMASINGNVIDRLRFPLGALYDAATVQAFLESTRGSTEADRKLALGVLLQHGDSSGGGDMAELSTGARPRERVFFSSARTSDQLNWDAAESTGPIYLASHAGFYDLRGAKRYVRAQVRAGKNSVTTESSGDEQSRVSGVIVFQAGDQLPPPGGSTAAQSTTTST